MERKRGGRKAKIIDGKKFCSKCQKLLPLNLTFFKRSKATSFGFKSCCRKCLHIEDKMTPGFKERKRRAAKRRNLKITEKNRINRELEECEICRVLSNKRRHAKDHDHKTGKLRGLLCFRCNTVLGLMKDNPNLFLGAIKYLRKYDD